MKTCPKCGELNGNNNTKCYKCGTPLGKIDGYKKICPKCGILYSSKTSRCEKCGGLLSVFSGEVLTGSSSDAEKWPYIIAILFPLIGIILGLIFIGQRKDEGPTVLITSIVASVVWGILWFIIF